MTKHRIVLMGLVTFVLVGCQSGGKFFDGASRKGQLSGTPEALPKLTHRQVLKEVNEHFTFRGRPIHPGLVKEFNCWISDLNPITIAVDVSAAFDSNEYSDEPYREKGYIYAETTEGLYGYRRLSYKNGIHLLKTVDISGGSQVFTSKLWVKFEIWKGTHPDGTAYDQLVMRLVQAK